MTDLTTEDLAALDKEAREAEANLERESAGCKPGDVPVFALIRRNVAVSEFTDALVNLYRAGKLAYVDVKGDLHE